MTFATMAGACFTDCLLPRCLSHTVTHVLLILARRHSTLEMMVQESTPIIYSLDVTA